MKSLFLPGYKYIFCLPSRRSRQIIGREIEIVYSFCSFVLIECSYVRCAARSCSSCWQHSPLSSFSFECASQRFVLSIDILHILLCNHNCYRNTHHINPNVLLKNSDSYNYSFYTSLLIQVLRQPVTKFFPPFFSHLWSPQYYRSTYHYLLFSIYYYLQHSIRKSVPSNQKGFHPSP